MSRIRITPTLTIDENEIEERFIQSSGPGGQNVNKVATAVQLRFDVAHSPSLPFELRARLMKLAGHRLTNDGVLVLTGRQYRLQPRNREDVRARLIELIRAASIVAKKRKPTRPTRTSKEKRLEGKKVQSRLKRMRSKRIED